MKPLILKCPKRLGQIRDYYVFSNGIYYNKRFFQPDNLGIVGIEKQFDSIDDLKKIIPGTIVKFNTEQKEITNVEEFIETVGENNIIEAIENKKLFYYFNLFLPYSSGFDVVFDDVDDKHVVPKKFKHNPKATLTFTDWADQMYKVYSRNTFIGVGFAMMSVFRDIIYQGNNGWNPLLFCFGPKEQGKSTFAKSLMSLFGDYSKDDGMNLEKLNNRQWYGESLGHL